MSTPALPFDDLPTTETAPTPATLREALERAIEGLIALLDVVDGAGLDEDLEDNGDKEPTTGASSLTDECEPDEDGEPSLAAPENHPHGAALAGDQRRRRGEGPVSRSRTGSQVSWSAGYDDDREDEHDGAEEETDAGAEDTGFDMEPDDEPSLGWTIPCSEGKTGSTGGELKGCTDGERADTEADIPTHSDFAAQRQARGEAQALLDKLPPSKRYGSGKGEHCNVSEYILYGPDGQLYRASAI